MLTDELRRHKKQAKATEAALLAAEKALLALRETGQASPKQRRPAPAPAAEADAAASDRERVERLEKEARSACPSSRAQPHARGKAL